MSNSFHIRNVPILENFNEAENAFSPTQNFEAIEQEFRDIDSFSEEQLSKVTGNSDLTTVEILSLQVNTYDPSTTVSQLGLYLPNLGQLDLSGSWLASFRDLGTSLKNLQILRLESSSIQDLDGIGALSGLKELYLKDNCISDLTPLSMHECLDTLDLCDNNICEMSQLDQLGTCLEMRTLSVKNNPVCAAEAFRQILHYCIPNVFMLDGTEITESDRTPPNEETISKIMNFVFPSTLQDSKLAQLQSITETVNDNSASFVKSTRVAFEESCEQPAPKELVDLQTQMLMKRPKSAHSYRNHPKSTMDLTPLGRKLCSTKVKGANTTNGPISYSSELTHGENEVFAGNIASSMRRRRSLAERKSIKPEANERKSIKDQMDGRSMDDILDELKRWKTDLEHNFAELKQCKLELKEIPNKSTENLIANSTELLLDQSLAEEKILIRPKSRSEVDADFNTSARRIPGMSDNAECSPGFEELNEFLLDLDPIDDLVSGDIKPVDAQIKKHVNNNFVNNQQQRCNSPSRPKIRPKTSTGIKRTKRTGSTQQSRRRRSEGVAKDGETNPNKIQNPRIRSARIRHSASTTSMRSSLVNVESKIDQQLDKSQDCSNEKKFTHTKIPVEEPKPQQFVRRKHKIKSSILA